MSHSSLILIAGLSTLAVVASWAPGCALDDNANCVNWVRNGMCVNPAYTNAQLRAYCPNACANSGCSGGSGTSGTGTGTSSTGCFDRLNPTTGVSDCPNRRNYCTNAVYRPLMEQQCPLTCGFCTSG